MVTNTRETLLLHPEDNVVVALQDLDVGRELVVNGNTITLQEPIATGHKLAIKPIHQREMVIKYGEEIGEATQNISVGEHVHVHNVRDITAEVTERERRRLGL